MGFNILYYMPKVIDRTGETNINFQGLKMKVESYRSATDMTILFEDGTKIKKAAYKEFSSGSIKNPNHRSVCGVGYFGQGIYKARLNPQRMTPAYKTWFNILSRCYDDDNNRSKNYEDVTVCEEWHNFQNFAEWHNRVFKEDVMDKWHIDKDIICKDCRVYSPETCVFVPNEINLLFSGNNRSKNNLPIGVSKHVDGKYQASVSKYNRQTYLGLFNTPEEAFYVFKEEKEKYLKEIAELWKDKIDQRVYEALMNYTVNITD